MDFTLLIYPFSRLLRHFVDLPHLVRPHQNVYIVLLSTSFIFFSFYLVKRLINRG